MKRRGVTCSTTAAITETVALIVLVGLVALATPTVAGASTTVISSGATAITMGSVLNGRGHGNHTCALLSGGRVDCWGFNDFGQLGDDSTIESPTPVQVLGLNAATAISAGNEQTCGLLAGGTVDCWGSNVFGQLGDGTTVDSSIPVQVSGLNGATAISSGFDDTCALLSGGTVECWGLGAGSLTPVQVSGINGATAISDAGTSTCALLLGGTAECWGENLLGELGDGTTIESPTPVQVSGLHGATAISTVDGHTCAVLIGGTAECWGENLLGELGDGTTIDSSIPVQVSGLNGATAISAGVDHTCALVSGGTAECWGENLPGEVGDVTTIGSSIPVQVSGLNGATGISVGEEQTCALLGDGAVECWGEGYGGRPALISGAGTQTEPHSNGNGPAPPQVRITSHPPKETADQEAEFEFTGVAGGAYECSIDARTWKSCKSGDSFSPLQPGDHRFEVRESLNGITGPGDSYSWTIDLPKACILKVARARVFAFTHQHKARLVIHYKAYEPAQVSVSYSLSGAKGSIALGTASARFKTAGVYRLTKKLGDAETAKLRATTSMRVRFSVPKAPSSCARYYTKQLTIPKKIFGQTTWFQSDSIFGQGAK